MVIDAVVTWVDGSDPVHEAKRAHWLKRAKLGPKVISKATIPHRFADDSEIVYCLRSIRKHAPWVRTIWLVTDDQFPAGFDRAIAEANGIRVIDHRHLFRGLEELLPTFNSMAIETLMWRIEGMADRFIFFNDDMFLCQPAKPADFFRDDKAVIRGHRVDWSGPPLTSHHHIAQMNAAVLAGVDLAQVFTPAHVPHPLFKTVMQALYHRHYLTFLTNAALRFRTNTRVHPVSLFNHEMVARKRAVLRSRKRTTYLGTGFCETAGEAELAERMDAVEGPDKLAFCINGFGSLASRLPDLTERMNRIVGGAQPWEVDARTRVSPIEAAQTTLCPA